MEQKFIVTRSQLKKLVQKSDKVYKNDVISEAIGQLASKNAITIDKQIATLEQKKKDFEKNTKKIVNDSTVVIDYSAKDKEIFFYSSKIHNDIMNAVVGSIAKKFKLQYKNGTIYVPKAKSSEDFRKVFNFKDINLYTQQIDKIISGWGHNGTKIHSY